MIRTELKRGTAELAILSVLEHGPLHGYEIGRQIEARSRGALCYTLAALYPLLYRMEHRGWLKAGTSPEEIVSGWSADLAAWDQLRRKYFLYK